MTSWDQKIECPIINIDLSSHHIRFKRAANKLGIFRRETEDEEMT